MNEADYIEQRLDDQIEWHDRKSSANQAAYKRLRLTEIAGAASIPLLAGYSDNLPQAGVVIGIIGLVVAVIAGIINLYRFQENWYEYRAVAESLKQEKFLYLAGAAPYDGDEAFQLLVQRVEGLLRTQNTEWARAMREAREKDRSEREEAGGEKG